MPHRNSGLPLVLSMNEIEYEYGDVLTVAARDPDFKARVESSSEVTLNLGG